MIRRRRRVGERARARIRAGGPSSVHRQALPRALWRALVARCTKREGGRCWWCGLPPTGARGPRLDPHHVVKRSLGGPDTDGNVVMLCRPCHDATDAPYSSGKLVIRSAGLCRFVGAVVFAEGKLEGREKAEALLRMAERALVEQ